MRSTGARQIHRMPLQHSLWCSRLSLGQQQLMRKIREARVPAGRPWWQVAHGKQHFEAVSGRSQATSRRMVAAARTTKTAMTPTRKARSSWTALEPSPAPAIMI